MMTGGNRGYIMISVYIIILMVVMHAAMPVIAANVTEAKVSVLSQAVKETESGIVKILVYAVDQKGNEYYVKQGTGILIGSENEEKIVLTNDKLVQVDEDLLNNIRRQFGLSAEGNLSIEVDLVLSVGTRIKTDIGSTGNDFIILNLAGDISNITCVKLGNSSSVKTNDKLYILGYDGNTNILGQSEIGNLDLQRNTVLVTDVTKEEIIIDFELDGGKIGTPVINEDGYVVGILAMKGTELYIQPIDRIKDILDVLNISYRGIKDDYHYNEVTEDIRNELNKILLECEELVVHKDKYTTKSIESLKQVITQTIDLTMNSGATYDDYQKAIEQLNKYKKKIRKKEYPIRMLQIGMGVGIIIFASFGIRTKRQIKKLKTESNTDYEGKIVKNEVVYAKLICLDTMQEVSIPSVIFRIGQNAGDIDYAIENNTSISRHHADIMKKGNGFYIMDNNSTNHTFVNDKQAMPGEYVSIKSGDIIRLADVYFRFEV